MPYGFNLFKADGSSVFGNSSRPFLMIGSDQTVAGTPVIISSVSHFWYPLANTTVLPRNFPAFCQLSAGEYIVSRSNGTEFGYLSNKSQLTFKYFKPANEFPDPTGYDFVTYNELGQKLWLGSEAAVTLDNKYNAPFGAPAPLVTTEKQADWVALISAKIRIIQGGASGGAQGLAIAQGIRRVDFFNWEYYSVSLGVGPNVDVPPSTMTFLTAT